MDYNIKLIRKQEQVTSNWSGGTTTQLAIYPEDSEYSKCNFKWRLSSARVNLEESTFTNLPGVQRLIMTIDGEMRLEHEGHYSIVLKPFEQDSFMGDWTTKSFGKVRDFNLMLKEGTRGTIERIKLDNEFKSFTYEYEKGKIIFEAFYCAHENAVIKVEEDRTFNLNEGDFILFEMMNSNRPINVEMKAEDGLNTNIIKASIVC